MGRTLVVTADDTTGALESAARAADEGWTTTVVPFGPAPVADARCTVIDLRSRHLGAGSAAQRMRSALRSAPVRAHKIDSTLRGNWPDELAAAVGEGRRVLDRAGVPGGRADMCRWRGLRARLTTRPHGTHRRSSLAGAYRPTCLAARRCGRTGLARRGRRVARRRRSRGSGRRSGRAAGVRGGEPRARARRSADRRHRSGHRRRRPMHAGTRRSTSAVALDHRPRAGRVRQPAPRQSRPGRRPGRRRRDAHRTVGRRRRNVRSAGARRQLTERSSGRRHGGGRRPRPSRPCPDPLVAARARSCCWVAIRPRR